MPLSGQNIQVSWKLKVPPCLFLFDAFPLSTVLASHWMALLNIKCISFCLLFCKPVLKSKLWRCTSLSFEGFKLWAETFSKCCRRNICIFLYLMDQKQLCWFCWCTCFSQEKYFMSLHCQSQVIYFHLKRVMFVSCLQMCAAGHRRVNSTLYKGECEPCHCYGHASLCDDITGHCLVKSMGIILGLFTRLEHKCFRTCGMKGDNLVQLSAVFDLPYL